MEYVEISDLFIKLEKLWQEKGELVVSIDGRCGSGKSTLAQQLQKRFGCNVVAMDDFYLPMEARAENWMEVPAGNMDLERLCREVLAPLKEKKDICYQPYLCHGTQAKPEQILPYRTLTIVEGSYSQYPTLADQYDLRIFVTCDRETQMSRLKKREGERLIHFEERWIPKEEQYFAAFRIQEHSDWVVDTGINERMT